MTDAANAAPAVSTTPSVATPANTSPITPTPDASPSPSAGVEGPGASAPATPPASIPEPLITDKPTDGKAAAANAPKEGEPPKEIEYNLKLPEGHQEDPELMGQFKELAKAEKLSPEVAQKIVDLAPRIGERIAQANQQQWNEMITGWQGQVRADPEIGGKNFEQSLSYITKAIDTYAPNEKAALLDAFKLTGAGSEPNIVKFIARLSRQVAEPSYVPGSGAAQKKGGAASLYPTMNKSA